MSDDILKALTEHLAKIPRHLRQRHTGILLQEAADRIRELEAEVAELRKIRDDERKKRE